MDIFLIRTEMEKVVEDETIVFSQLTCIPKSRWHDVDYAYGRVIELSVEEKEIKGKGYYDRHFPYNRQKHLGLFKKLLEG